MNSCQFKATPTTFHFTVRHLSFPKSANIWWHLLLETSLHTTRSICKKKNKLNTNRVPSYSQSLSRSAQARQLCAPTLLPSQTWSSNTCTTADHRRHVSGPSETLRLHGAFDDARTSCLSKQILRAYFPKHWSVCTPVARKSRQTLIRESERASEESHKHLSEPGSPVMDWERIRLLFETWLKLYSRCGCTHLDVLLRRLGFLTACIRGLFQTLRQSYFASHPEFSGFHAGVIRLPAPLLYVLLPVALSASFPRRGENIRLCCVWQYNYGPFRLKVNNPIDR